MSRGASPRGPSTPSRPCCSSSRSCSPPCASASARVASPTGRRSCSASTQGFSELLPISSSGHLILVPWLADWRYLETHPDFNKTFDVALHLGTLVAVVAYFWADVVRYVRAWVASVGAARDPHGRRAPRVGDRVATIPAGDRRRAGENAIDNHLGEPWQIAIFLASSACCSGSPTATPERAPPRRPRPRTRLRDRPLADARADARRLALGDHDHDRALQRPRPRRRGALLVPAADPDRARRGPLEGPEARRARPAACRARQGRSSSARSRRRRSASSRSTCCSATCGGTTTRRSCCTGSPSPPRS